MTSWAQFQANRRNALRSTGPKKRPLCSGTKGAGRPAAATFREKLLELAGGLRTKSNVWPYSSGAALEFHGDDATVLARLAPGWAAC